MNVLYIIVPAAGFLAALAGTIIVALSLRGEQ